MRVDFPLPLGPDTMIKGARAPTGSLDILHQLANLLQRALDLDNMPGDLDIAGLRPDRVGFPEHLLSQKLELAPRALGLVDDLLELIEMAGQSDHLLANVGAFRENRHLLDK